MQISWGGFVDWTTSNAKRCGMAAFLKPLVGLNSHLVYEIHAKCPNSTNMFAIFYLFCACAVKTLRILHTNDNMSIELKHGVWESWTILDCAHKNMPWFWNCRYFLLSCLTVTCREHFLYVHMTKRRRARGGGAAAIDKKPEGFFVDSAVPPFLP